MKAKPSKQTTWLLDPDETPGPIYPKTRRYVAEDLYLLQDRCESFKSRLITSKPCNQQTDVIWAVEPELIST